MIKHMSCLKSALSTLIFATVVTANLQQLGTFIRDALKSDSSHNGGNNGGHGNDDGDYHKYPSATIILNNDHFDMPIFPKYDAFPLDYEQRIHRARIRHAPPGYGCFFWSTADSPSSSLRGETFISKTFYSHANDYTSFEFLVNPGYLVCFKLPNPEAPDEVVAVWAESFESDISPFHSGIGFITLRQYAEVRSGSFRTPDWPTLDRVAVVHATDPKTECIAGGGSKIVDGTGPLETVAFTARMPSVERLEAPMAIMCYT